MKMDETTHCDHKARVAVSRAAVGDDPTRASSSRAGIVVVYSAAMNTATDTPAARTSATDAGDRFNYQYVVIEVNEDASILSRDELVSLLLCENVSARRYFFPGCHRMEPYVRRPPPQLPVTDAISGSVICLPTGTAVSLLHVRAICALLRLLVSNGAAVAARVRALPLTPPIEPQQLPPPPRARRRDELGDEGTGGGAIPPR